MGTRRKPTDAERKAFQDEFGIEPSGNPRLAELELRIINNELANDRWRIGKLAGRLRELKALCAKAENPETLKAMHAEAAAKADELDRLTGRQRRRILLARTFGFKPEVYRGRGGGGR